MPRFVILEHDFPVLHWDLLIEKGPALRAWRLAEPPDQATAIKAQANFDHRLMYLDYEGEVSGNRGRVSRWDLGEYELVEGGPARVVLRLKGLRIEGLVCLEMQADECWLFHRVREGT